MLWNYTIILEMPEQNLLKNCTQQMGKKIDYIRISGFLKFELVKNVLQNEHILWDIYRRSPPIPRSMPYAMKKRQPGKICSMVTCKVFIL